MESEIDDLVRRLVSLEDELEQKLEAQPTPPSMKMPKSTGGGPGLFQSSSRSGERWTIRCYQSAAPDHAETCEHLAKLLRDVPNLKASAVRVRSDAFSSTLYYGEYAKVPAAEFTGDKVNGFVKVFTGDFSATLLAEAEASAAVVDLLPRRAAVHGGRVHAGGRGRGRGLRQRQPRGRSQ